MESAAQPTRVILVEDQAILRDVLASYLDSDPALRLLRSVATLGEARIAIEAEPVDVVVLDLKLPDGTGLDLVKEFEGRDLPRFVLLTAHEQPWILRDAMRSKAAGIVMKGAPVSDLRAVIDAVVRGEVATCRRTSVLLREHARSETRLDALTAREREILALVARGASSRAIGESLGIREKTVQNHRANILEKLDLHDTPSLVRLAIAEGLVDDEPRR